MPLSPLSVYNRDDETAAERQLGGDQASANATIAGVDPPGPVPAEKKVAIVVSRRGVCFPVGKQPARGCNTEV